MHIGKLASLAVVFSGSLFAQGARYDSTSTTTNASCAPGSLCPVLAIPGTAVSVCIGARSSLGDCQSNPAVTYSNFSITTACPSTAQLTPAAGGACSATSDSTGAFGFWVGTAGTFSYFISLPSGGTYGPYIVTPGGGLVSGVSSINTTLTGNVVNVVLTTLANTFTQPQTISASSATLPGLHVINPAGGGAALFDTSITIDSNGGAELLLSGAATSGTGRLRSIDYFTDPIGTGTFRWRVGTDLAPETGGNAGSNFRIQGCTDAGACSDDITINRASGLVTVPNAMTVTGALAAGSVTTSGTGTFGTQLTIDSNAGAELLLSGAATNLTGRLRSIDYFTDPIGTGTFRWRVGTDLAPETGSNAGSNFRIQGCTDAGACSIDLSITRSSGVINIPNILDVGSLVSTGTGQFGGTGTATSGLIMLLDASNVATGIEILETISGLPTREADWNATPTSSFSVVNNIGTNDFIVLQGAGVRIPHTPGGTGGLAACFDGSFNLYKSTTGGCP